MSQITEAKRLFTEEGWSKSQIAEYLGVHRRTIGRWFANLGLIPSVPSDVGGSPINDDEVTHLAELRAKNLQNTIREAITGTRYPVINPEVLSVESRINTLTRKGGEEVKFAATPKTHISDIMRVAKIQDYKNKTFIFTCAQNAAPIHKELWVNLKAYANHLGAEIVVGPNTYKTNWWDEKNSNCRQYDPLISDYICYGSMQIGDEFTFAAEMTINITASSPLSGLSPYSKGKWAVYPHPKHHLQAIAKTDVAGVTKQNITTGSITLPKVQPSKTGNQSIFNHIQGFVVVEFGPNGEVFVRQVDAERNGSFFDLWWRVEKGKVRVASDTERPDYLMPGDVHRAKLDRALPQDVLTTFGDGGMITTLNPHRIILQDLHDGEVDNHHAKDDMAYKVELAARDRHKLEYEVNGDARFLQELVEIHPYLDEILVVESNHDLRIDKYINSGRYRNDPFNIKYGLELEWRVMNHRMEVAKALENGKLPPPFSLSEFAIRDKIEEEVNAKIKWVYDGSSCIIKNVEVGHHGFRGTNGSRASIQQYAKLGAKISYGDKHSPGIYDGAFQAGVITQQQGYNLGPSSWAVSHILQYANGKRTIITLQNGRFTNQRSPLVA